MGGSGSASGDTMVVGARLYDDNGERSGSAYAFRLFTPVTWAYVPMVLRSAP